MNTRIIAAVAALAFAAFSFFCIRAHAPEIAADIAARSSGALATAGMGSVSVNANGRELSLAGLVPTEDARLRAERLVAEVRGVRHVTNDLQVRPAPITTAVATVVPAVVTPYEFRITRTPDAITLKGLVPDSATRREVLNQASQAFGSATIQDEIEIANGAPADWSRALAAIQNELSGYVQGDAYLSGANIRVRGLVAADRDSATTRLAAAIPAQYKADINLSMPVQNNTAVCQSQLNQILVNNRINFATSSATISNTSFALLDQLTATIRGCPSARIEVAGHTDSQGAADANVALSQRRAQAVVSYLVAAGIPAAQLDAQGFGETQPIRANDTPEGRARNRRIEFNVTGMER